jgi:hypothetical protein
MQRLESEKTLFFVEIGWRNVSFRVMVSVIELRHVSSRNGHPILSEYKFGIQQTGTEGVRRTKKDLSG